MINVLKRLAFLLGQIPLLILSIMLPVSIVFTIPLDIVLVLPVWIFTGHRRAWATIVITGTVWISWEIFTDLLWGEDDD